MRYEVQNLRGVHKLEDLFQKNAQESGIFARPLSISWAMYDALADQSPSFLLVAYDGETVAGAAVVLIMRHPHVEGLLATNDTIYVCPQYRARGVGGRLFQLAEKEAKRRGAFAFLWDAALGSPLANALAKRVPLKNQRRSFVRYM